VRRTSLVCGAFLTGLGVVASLEALRMRDGWTGAPLMPVLVGGVLVVLGAAHLGAPVTEGAWPGAAGIGRVAGMLGLLVLYVALLPPLGFLLATGLFTLPVVRALASWSWPATLATTAAIAVASDVVFKHWLGMPLPVGLLGR
jgi:hypothetical protein